MASSSYETDHNYPSIIELNVGGRHFTTTLLTLTKRRDTMLGAMFSGMHRQPQDKNGCYFIDADGDTFACILRYLRDGELPPTDMIERVYNSALYFGLQDLVSELEMTPKIMALQMKEKMHAQLGNFHNTVKTILNAAINSPSRDSLWPRTKLIVAVQHKDSQPTYFNLSHKCASHNKNEWVYAHILIGPITCSMVTEGDYMQAIVQELISRGFMVQLQEVGKCDVGHEEIVVDPEHVEEHCYAQIYSLLFHWN